MSQRYYLAPIIGTGTEADPYRADLPAVSHAAIITTDARGVPERGFAAVQVSAGMIRHASMGMDSTYKQVPSDLDLQMTSDERSSVVAWLNDKGGRSLDVPAVLTWRDMLHLTAIFLRAPRGELPRAA